MHYASENMFERFWRIKFFDMAAQRLAVPTFQIKATQAPGGVLDPYLGIGEPLRVRNPDPV